jgi:malonate-semialdehyde dehydrogenase (acetylating) / methylmalonate-semialdehyde dehydrogenase
MPETVAAGAETEVKTLRNYINGGWVDAATADTLDDRDPATGELAARVPLSGAADVDAAVRAAADAQPAWRAVPVQRRARAVIALRDALVANQRRIAELVTADMGKTIADAEGEVGRGIESVESAIAAPHLLKGENLEGVAKGLDVELVRQPVGVVAAITPFNFPAMIPLWFLPYAIVCGNSFVLKPSERDPRPSELIYELIDSIDEIPDGVLSLVHGGREAVEAIWEHPRIDAISFVGQAKTARLIATKGAEHGKRVQALGGAKNAMVVMPDAEPELMVKGVLGSAFGAAGQRCLAGSLLVLVGSDSEQDSALERIATAASELRVGPGADPETDVCPLVGPDARERIEGEIATAVADGAELVIDGRGDGGPGGAELGPTIIDRAPLDSRAVREEIFGPVLTVVRASDLEGAISVVNQSRYGNATAIFTSSGEAARTYRYGIGAGMVGVNIGVPAPVAWFPFAGWKDSIDGDLHSNGFDAIDFYTRKKVVTSRWS